MTKICECKENTEPKELIQAYGIYRKEYRNFGEISMPEERLDIDFEEDQAKFMVKLKCAEYNDISTKLSDDECYDRYKIPNGWGFKNAKGHIVEISYRPIFLEVVK